MVAADPQRTSWTAEEIPGNLYPLWYRPIEPYINYKTQVIAAKGLLYISTARGLYALDAEDGDLVWVYPTEMPLGNSPTVAGDVVYVGGYDRKIHAINALTGEKVPTWRSFEAEAGFETNPLVVDGMVYAGNRDGNMVALDAVSGDLVWRYQTDGPVLFSAAYENGVIYFASNDSHAYGLNAKDGSLIWKSDKLPGAGFVSYWPVVYRDWVIFVGSTNYRMGPANKAWPDIGKSHLHSLEAGEIYPNREADPSGTLVGPAGREPGDWVDGTLTIDTSRPTVTENGSTKSITEYFEEKPWRRTVFVLDKRSGEELTFDSDGDGRPEYAPFLWMGTKGGNRYPPVVGSDGVLYLPNNYLSDRWIPGGHVVGWKIGTPFISRASGWWNAVDEPMAVSAGGDLIYWGRCVDRMAGAFDITKPYGTSGREWDYFSYNLADLIPGYDPGYYTSPADDRDYLRVFGNINGVYGTHGVQNPPIPYRGKVYMLRGNAVIALSPGRGTPVKLPRIETVPTQDPAPHVTAEWLKARLATEVEEMLNAGHLRPGYHVVGDWDPKANPQAGNGDYLSDYWHNPADTLYTLIRALPYLPEDLQRRTKGYLQKEFADYPPYAIAHMGWQDGASREAHDTPPEIQENMDAFAPRARSTNQYDQPAGFWAFPQDTFYGLWRYAQVFGGAKEIFDQAKDKLESPPGDRYLAARPHIHNAYIAGYLGYLGLEELAGLPESAPVRAELDRLLSLRASQFSKDSTFSGRDYMRVLNVSRNFMYLVPELGDYLHDHALAEVRQAIDEYNEIAPGWFVSRYDATFAEGSPQVLYDVHAIFQAKALILREPREELVRYLDVPAFARGDLFYIQNLVAAIEAAGGGTFADVPVTHPYYAEIEALYRAGYTAGCGTDPLRYCPDRAMTRAESAVFVERGIHGVEVVPEQPAAQTFADLPLASWAAKWATALYGDGYTAGCEAEPLAYCPWRGHSRAEGAVFYLRMLNGVDYDPPAATGIFADVPLGAWYARWAEAAYGAGLIPACGEAPLRFCPEDPLTRGLAAAMMVQAKGLPLP